MTALSLVAREMRGLSRRPANQWLRVLAAGVLIGFFAYGVLILRADLSAGDRIFEALGFLLTLALWILVPVMTADCVSREKREGTLGLLFLTPLTVLDVIVAKSAVHALRAFTLFLAAVPVLVLPFIIGGVSWQTVCLTLADQLNATLLGLAAAIWASTRGGSVTQVVVRALLMTGLVACLSYVPVMVVTGGGRARRCRWCLPSSIWRPAGGFASFSAPCSSGGHCAGSRGLGTRTRPASTSPGGWRCFRRRISGGGCSAGTGRRRGIGTRSRGCRSIPGLPG